jgi:hypothetical protein
MPTDPAVPCVPLPLPLPRPFPQGAHEGLNAVAFTCDSRLVLGAEDRAAVRVWGVRSGRLAGVALTGHAKRVTGVAASPADPAVAATCSADRSIKVRRAGAAGWGALVLVEARVLWGPGRVFFFFFLCFVWEGCWRRRRHGRQRLRPPPALPRARPPGAPRVLPPLPPAPT